MNKQHSTPILIENNSSCSLKRIPISGRDSKYNEAFIQDLTFKHPESLPVGEIDRSYENLIPICCELSTPAGPLDILYVTPTGRIVIAETKLWRNPEARRKVVAQILDYAKELSKWSYEDLQREVSKSLGRKGNVLFEIINDTYPDLDEAMFVDEVAKSLKQGRFLLLIIGDGIREGTENLTEFIENSGNLDFTFGLIELAMYEMPNKSIVLQPRILAKTIVIKRTIISIKDGVPFVEDPDIEDKIEKEHWSAPYQEFYSIFWPELISELKLDDPSQPKPTGGKMGNIFFYMPLPNHSAWITVYFLKSKGNLGAFLTFSKNNLGDLAYQSLLNEKQQLSEDMTFPLEWESKNGKHSICSYQNFDDFYDPKYRTEIKSFLKLIINEFVNAFRPRLQAIAKDLD